MPLMLSYISVVIESRHITMTHHGYIFTQYHQAILESKRALCISWKELLEDISQFMCLHACFSCHNWHCGHGCGSTPPNGTVFLGSIFIPIELWYTYPDGHAQDILHNSIEIYGECSLPARQNVGSRGRTLKVCKSCFRGTNDMFNIVPCIEYQT